MTWTLVGVGTRVGTGSGGGNITLTPPGSLAEGDLLRAVFIATGDVQFTAPSGWTQLAVVPGAASSTEPMLQVFWIKRGASNPSFAFTRTGGGGASGQVIAHRPSSGDFSLTGASSAQTANGTTHTISGVTTAGANDLVVASGGFGAARDCTNVTAATDPSTGSGSTADTSTAPTAGTWILRYEYNVSASQSYGVADADAIRATAGATGNVTVTSSGNAVGAVIAASFTESASGDTISVTEIQENYIHDGRAGSATITIGGSHSGATDTIEVQIEYASGGVAIAWQTLQASVAAGSFSGTVSVPRGDWYIARVRKASDTGVTAVQTQKWGVGLIIGLFGQSLAGEFITVGTGSPGTSSMTHNGTAYVQASTTGAGRAAMLNELVSLCGCPCALISLGSGGSAISDWWSSGKTTNYNTWEALVTDAGGELSGFAFWQGNTDANTATAKATYKAALQAIYSQLRTDYGAGLKGVVMALGRGVGTDADWEDIRDAHLEVGAETGNTSATVVDLATTDGVHLSDVTYAEAGVRMAHAFAGLFGNASDGIGPTITSASYAGAAVTVTLTHDQGTDITPSTGITGFRVLDNGTPATISSAVRASATTITLTCSASLSGPVTVQYLYGDAPTVTGAVYDNTTTALPLRSTAADITAVGPLSVTLDPLKDEGDAVRASYSVSKVYAIRLSDDTIVAQWNSQTTDGSGQLALADAALTAAPHLFVTYSSTGDKAGAKVYTPA